jgi:multidrug efflux pump subunit AcrB
VLGITARNAVLLVHSYQDATADGGPPDEPQVLVATRAHATPIVLTALLLAGAALPFTFSSGVAGAEVVHPLAVTVLGGLVTSTLCSLVLLPALYARIAGRHGR